jgi:undecaprenyl-diphosphatase
MNGGFSSLTFVAMEYILTSFWPQLEQWDRKLFVVLNSKWTNQFFDAVLPYFRDAVFWSPFYIFILSFIALNYGRKGVMWSIGLLCAVAIADMTSSRIFKEFFERMRPCNDPLLIEQVRLLLHKCGSGFSFTSSHAANHFAIATFISITLNSTFKRWIYLIFIWAIFISYAQVYVGVHYPLDVLGGAGIGTFAGIFTAWIFKSKVGSFTIDKQLAL